MDKFEEQLDVLSKRVESMKESIITEEATKTSIIMPFFQMLGYDIFNPNEFAPEFTADVGLKKGEKVDYAIMNDGEPIILIEAKSISESLTKHDSQLFRYFGTTSAKFAILTNGLIYRFFTDLEENNKMDSEPFFEFNLLELKENKVHELSKFKKDSFDLNEIFDTASDLKYINKTREFLSEQWHSPSDEFIHFVTGQIYDGKRTKATLERFEPIIKKTFKQFINDLVNERLNAALYKTRNEDKEQIDNNEEDDNELTPSPDDLIVTTEEEIEGYSIVKVILKDIMDVDRVYYRDNKSYFNILLDDNIRRWVVRLGFNNKHKYIQFNDDERTVQHIVNVTDISDYENKIKDVAKQLI